MNTTYSGFSLASSRKALHEMKSQMSDTLLESSNVIEITSPPGAKGLEVVTD